MVVSADRNTIDPPIYNIVSRIDSPIPIVPITRVDNYEFNPALLELKEYVLMCFCEYGWNYDLKKTHLFTKNTGSFADLFQGEEWEKFDDWVRENPPKLYFKRECVDEKLPDYVKPIEYPSWSIIPPFQTREEFNARPINIFSFWGRSSEDRVRLHADIWAKSGMYGAAVCDNIYYVGQFLRQETCPNKWVTLNVPHFARHDLGEILGINGLSKLSISEPGAGVKCFRHSESPVNSIMAMPYDNMLWTYPWEHGVNCIKYRRGFEVQDLDEALARPDLYEIYLRGIETVRKYQWDNYKIHIENTIKDAI